VRVEIVGALETGTRVIPVLVGGADMPRAEDLPDDLRPLACRQAIRITLERVKSDAQGLVGQIRSALAEVEARRHAATEAEQAEFRDHLARYAGGPTERFATERLARTPRHRLGSRRCADPGRGRGSSADRSRRHRRCPRRPPGGGVGPAPQGPMTLDTMTRDPVPTLEELDRVALAAPQPTHGLDVGDLGTIVAVHDGGRGYTVEFVALTGETIAILTLAAESVRPCARAKFPTSASWPIPLSRRSSDVAGFATRG
jgi:hypothetical protein